MFGVIRGFRYFIKKCRKQTKNKLNLSVAGDARAHTHGGKRSRFRKGKPPRASGTSGGKVPCENEEEEEKSPGWPPARHRLISIYANELLIAAVMTPEREIFSSRHVFVTARFTGCFLPPHPPQESRSARRR